MELGISPIITAGMIMQLLLGAKLINLNLSDENDKAMFDKSSKLAALAIGLLEAVVYVWSGMYGEIETIGAVNAVLIVIQLTVAAILVTYLDEILSSGHGMGSAISLFIATNVCEEIFWKTFSPMSYGNEYEGALINFFYLLVFKENKLAAIQGAFYRDFGPNINNLLATVFIFLLVIFLQGWQVAIGIHRTGIKGSVQPYAVKLFYTSNMPIILMSALISNVFFVSKMLYKRFGSFFLVRLLGRWKDASMGGASYPVSGLAYYISPPHSLTNMITDPVHGIVYIFFILATCALFSKTWAEISGQSPSNVYKNLKDQGYTGMGGDYLMKKRLEMKINTASILSGIFVGVLTIVADFLGAIGSGTGILLSVGIVFEMLEQYQQEFGKQGLFGR
jgi:protein transport protein SEC61 subunit alpha